MNPARGTGSSVPDQISAGGPPTARPSLDDAVTVILVRHGETEHTQADLFSGRGSNPQPSLTAEGGRQADAAGRWVRDMLAPRRPAPPDGDLDQLTLLTSPLPRTVQTAHRVQQALASSLPTSDERWAEADFGQWEGRSPGEVAQQDPERWIRLFEDPQAGPPGGESRMQVQARVAGALQPVLAQPPGSIVVVSTHLTPIRAVLAELLDLPWSALRAVQASPGSVTTLGVWPQRFAALLALGERPNMGPV